MKFILYTQDKKYFILSFQIITIDIPFLAENLQMYNFTGSSITNNYIQNRLARSYSGYFEFIIMNQNVMGNSFIYSVSGSSVFILSGVNTAQPCWVYIINIRTSTNVLTYIDNFLYGSFTLQQHGAINNILTQVEGPGSCSCLGMTTISQLLTNYFGSK